MAMYRQSLPDHNLSIEQDTDAVPSDGFYYVIQNGVQQGRYRSLAQAQKRYTEIKKTLDIKQPPERKPVSSTEAWERELASQSNKSLLWDNEDFARVERKTQGRPKH
jgi:hypothetical protein